MSIRDIVKTIGMKVIASRAGEGPTSCRILEYENLRDFARAVPLRDIGLFLSPVEHPERPDHFCMAIEVCCSQDHSFRVLLDERTSYGLAAIYATHTLREQDTGQKIAFMNLWTKSIAMIDNIRQWQDKRDVAPDLFPLPHSLRSMARYAREVLDY